MKKVTVFCLCLIFLASCKSKGNSEGDNEADVNLIESKELKIISGKVVGEKRKPIAYAAVKLYLDEDDCMHAYTGDDGSFEFKLDELRIKEQSHFEVVYKGYAINFLSLRNFKNDGSIILSKKGKVVPAAEYHVFYESIKSCGRK
ncbi:hypothetical protein [Aquimarina celericrescens]|uniref:Carboxypeptidase regulatory-like domain-containing protein n=1 Tax=Aquimarina celericrescens TaxID=1964542 RepID=A0ABW5AXE8_9FLAO|nr:hypothetical protein [Aquimarina celericrescens]